MKYLYAPLLLLLLASCAEEKKETPKPEHSTTDWAFYKLNGDVQSVSEKSLKLTAGPSVTGSEIATAHDTDLYFDENGNLVSEKQWLNGTTPFEENAYNGRVKLLRRTQYVAGQPGIITENLWDESGKNLNSETKRNPDNSQLDRTTYTYTNGNLTEKIKLNGQNNPTDKWTYEYDAKGNITEDAIYTGTGAVIAQNRYKYDGANHKVAELRYVHDSLRYSTKYDYIGNNLMKRETTNSKGVPEYTEVFKYDAPGNVISHVTLERLDSSQTEDIYTYDKNKNIISWTVNQKGSPKINTLNVYDQYNNLTATKTTDETGKVINDRKYTYEYDSHNNWIKKHVVIDGKPAFEVSRKISYYENK